MSDFDFLYHATYTPLLDSIKKTGLGGTTQTYWEDSKPGTVYLSIDKDVAISYAEANENIPEDWLDQIVVLIIPFDKLDPDYLEIDQNVQDNEGVTLEYHKIIPYSDFYKVEQNEAINPAPKHRRFNHTNPGNIIRCLNPECNRVFGFDSKVSSDEFDLLFCPHCGHKLPKENYLNNAIQTSVEFIKPKASVLYFEIINDKTLEDMEKDLKELTKNKI